MNQTEQALTKIAEELIDWTDALESENLQLKEQLASQQKQASQAVPVAPVVSEAVANETCQALVSAGALTSDQVDLVKQGFLKDPAAAHRAIVGILNSRSDITKEAREFDLSGGQTVNSEKLRKTAADTCFDNMRRILNAY